MKKIIETIKRKWAEYLLEVIVIVGSILGAFALDTWNDERKERKKESNYISQIKNSLRNDLEKQLIPSINYMNDKLNNYSFVKRNLLNNDSVDSIKLVGSNLIQILSTWVYIFETSTYENLKSIGIDIIKNDSLRSEISQLYSIYYPDLIWTNKYVYGTRDKAVESLLSNNIPITNSEYSLFELESIKSDVEIKGNIYMLNNRRSFQKKSAIEVIERAKRIIKQIDDL